MLVGHTLVTAHAYVQSVDVEQLFRDTCLKQRKPRCHGCNSRQQPRVSGDGVCPVQMWRWWEVDGERVERGWRASDRSGGRGKRTGSKSRVQSPDCSSGSDAMALDVGEAPALIRPLRALIMLFLAETLDIVAILDVCTHFYLTAQPHSCSLATATQTPEIASATAHFSPLITPSSIEFGS
jgi:hypothetical protein